VNIGSTALPNAASPSVTCNNMTGVKTVLTPDSYTLTEPGPLPSGFTLPTSGTGAIGVTGWSAPGAFGGDCSATGGVSLANGQNKTCYILNVSSVCTPALPAPSSVPSILPQGRQPASRPTRVQRPASTN
jgi:hypothetical protein